MKDIVRYFTNLDTVALSRLERLQGLYSDWNSKINVISRKDMDNFYTHHVLHSLAIAKAIDFPSGSRVLDLGTGGGFPGIPLAILFPEVRFTLCDSIGKKVMVAQSVAQTLSLDNVECINARVETLKREFDFVVSRAVADLSDLYGWTKGKYTDKVICLKGGDVESEITRCASRCHIKSSLFTFCDISMWFDDEYFKEKKIVMISR